MEQNHDLKHENIPVGCKLPACQPFIIEQVWICGGAAAKAGTGGKGSLYGEVQCIMANGYMGPPRGQNEWLTDTTENITFPQPKQKSEFCGRLYLFKLTISAPGQNTILNR